jgi:hypothetical protein
MKGYNMILKQRLNASLLAVTALIVMPLATLTPPEAQAQTKAATESVVDNVGSVAIDWTQGIVRVTGAGAPPDRGSAAHKRLMAERAATADAYRQLAEAINGVRVDAETLVRDYVTESDVIRTKVNALIKGAQKVNTRYLSDGSIEVDMVVKLYNQAGLSGVIQPQKNRVPPPPVELKPEPQPGEYTGIIIDCRGLGVQAAMSPAILNQSGGEVYIGNLPVDPDFVVNNGIVGYSKSLNDARQNARVGKNPLIIKALNVSGRHKADVVISEKDSRILLGLQASYQVLEKAKVLFVL